MRVPLSWLAEYVDLPSGATAESVMAELVKVGLEEEGVHRFGVSGPIVVGEVLEFTPEPQSNGKTIRWCQVRVAPQGLRAADGGEDVRGIVCGASNFEVGDKVVVCLPGAELPGDFKIAARSTYGHISDGMMASARELNLSDDHAGIIRLREWGLDPKVGTDALELLQLTEEAAEVNVTPDRGYCFSIRGVAREYAHATKGEFRDPKGNAFLSSLHGFDFKVDDESPLRGNIGCDRFVLKVVEGIDPSRPTPPWMVARLKLSGMRSISLVVDITNYVMLELGQPTHAYDLDKVTGGITVRRAKKGETLKTLDGQVRKLDAEDLLIADGSGPIGLAGVMGGESTEVSDSTTRVIVEAAHFDPITIARSARRHKLSSEASKRFERGVDPRMADNAVARVVQLLEVHAGGTGSDLGVDHNSIPASKAIFLPDGFAESLVGVEFTAAETSATLREIGCVVAAVDGGFEVIPPTWRPDITHKTDLVEELARIGGYDRIPSRLPVAPPGRGLTVRQKQRRKVINALVGAGHTEILNYPFVGEAANRWFETNAEQGATVLANPMQEESKYMRLSLLPGLLDAAKRNLSRGLTSLAIFEEGSVFRPTIGAAKKVTLPTGAHLPTPAQLNALNASIPAQPKHVAGVILGERTPHAAGQRAIEASYRDAVFAAQTAAHAVGVSLELRQGELKGFHPGRGAELIVEDRVVGVAGELDPALALDNDLPRRVAIFEIDLDALAAAAPAVVQAQAIHIYPAATQDLSLVVDRSLPAGEVLAAIYRGAGELLEHAILVDDYRGENVADNKKSLTFALRFRAPDRTLTQAEASVSRDSAVALAADLFGAVIRA